MSRDTLLSLLCAGRALLRAAYHTARRDRRGAQRHLSWAREYLRCARGGDL